MNETAIEIKDLRKVYKIYQSPGQRLKEILLRKTYHEEFIALDNIELSVHQGETIGIIGENGAGKSTLLKILAKTLKPTSGTVSTKGKISALLELGAGFDPELTGEENIYLNAYLMGLSKDEIDSKKEEIVNFSELNDFIKRPVKTYSSGMHVRLAFSIASSVDPDLMIIDEALSVGDEYFQKKCIDRMMAFRDSGKTILFCSHGLYRVQELCQRTMWLHRGEIKSMGETDEVVTEYQNFQRERTGTLQKDKALDSTTNPDEELVKISDDKPMKMSEEKRICIVDVKVKDKDGVETEVLESLSPAVFSFKIHCKERGVKGHVGFYIKRNDEVVAFATGTGIDGFVPINLNDGQEFQVRFESLTLLAGKYNILLAVTDEFGIHIYEQITKTFSIPRCRKEHGIVFIEHKWII